MEGVFFCLNLNSSYKYTADYDKRLTFDIGKFFNRKIKLKADEEYEMADADV